MNRNAGLFFVCFGGLLVASFGGVGTAASTPLGTSQDKPDAAGNGDFVIGPDYEVDPDLKDKGNPKGQAFEFSMTLADSKIFPGNDSTLDPKKPVRKERKIFVYVPAAYKNGTKAPRSEERRVGKECR